MRCHWALQTSLDSSVSAKDFEGLMEGFDPCEILERLFEVFVWHSSSLCGVDAENFHTLALDNVPLFGAHNRSAAYRFVTLVDVSLCTLLKFGVEHSACLQ